MSLDAFRFFFIITFSRYNDGLYAINRRILKFESLIYSVFLIRIRINPYHFGSGSASKAKFRSCGYGGPWALTVEAWIRVQ